MAVDPLTPAAEALIEQPAATPEALREAVRALAPERLGEFLSDLAHAKAASAQTAGIRPMLAFYTKWSQFAALYRFPQRRARLEELERIVRDEADPVKNREAINAVSALLAEVDAEIAQ